jgi:hypothetical protein
MQNELIIFFLFLKFFYIACKPYINVKENGAIIPISNTTHNWLLFRTTQETYEQYPPIIASTYV